MLSFSELYQRYSRDVFRFSLYLSGNRAQAEDITAETFARVWIAKGDLRNATVKSYLFAIARNLYLQEMRRERRRGSLDVSIADPAAGPEQSRQTREEMEAMLRGLQQLGETDRAVLLMRSLENMSYEEIAAATGLTVAACKVKVHRARMKLAEMTQKERV
jgi:RNA polymerase sigma-70 factor (ECF subfamily)